MTDRSRMRLIVLQVLVLSVVATLLGRLWYLQVMTGEEYKAAATENRVREVVTQPVRGLILDDRGRPLVQNRTTLVVSVDRTELGKQADDGVEVVARLATTLGTTPEAINDRITLCGTEQAKARGLRSPVCWNGSPYQPVPVAEDVQAAVALAIMERQEDYPGITAEFQSLRQYPSFEGANASHLLGYLGPVTEDEVDASEGSSNRLRDRDLIGRAGLEGQYDAILRGVPGIKELSVDRDANVTGVVGEQAAIAGNHLVTSIDAKVQAVTEKALLDAITKARTVTDEDTNKKYPADSGAAVVMDAKTGHIVAMASYPSYDPAVWVGGVSDADYAALTDEKAGVPLLSRATAGEFAPASTWKAVTTAAAVKAGYSLYSDYPCTSSYEVGNRKFKNYESRAYGDIDLKRTLEISCDTVYYKFAYEMWLRDGGNTPKSNASDAMLEESLAWGFGEKTGIDVPGERSGSIVTRETKQNTWEELKDSWCRRAVNGYPEAPSAREAAEWKASAAENCADGFKYRAGDAVNFSIGQGDSTVTPLQLVRAYAALGNGGTLWKPQVAKAVLSPTGEVVQQFAPTSAGTLPVDSTLRNYIVDALHQVTLTGTGKTAFAGWPQAAIPVAGKTGTAEVANKSETSWFASFAPATNPQYAVVVMVSQGGTGGTVAAPAARAIYDQLFGVVNGVVTPAKAAIPSIVPPTVLPKVRPDGTVERPADARQTRQ